MKHVKLPSFVTKKGRRRVKVNWRIRGKSIRLILLIADYF
jgi:hypothetical protein